MSCFINLTERGIKKGKKGQISVEYLIVVGFVAFLVIGLLSVALIYSAGIKDRIKFNQLESFARKIIDSAESVYYSGEPSKLTITAYLPQGVNEIRIEGKDLTFDVITSSGVTVISYTSKVELDGSLSVNEGVKVIEVVAQSDNVLLNG